MSPHITNGKQAFFPPVLNLDHSEGKEGDARTLPELVEFHAKLNPRHLFCKQALRTQSDPDLSFLDVNYSLLKQAILKCQKWLRSNIKQLQLPAVDPAKNTSRKGQPVTLFIDSDVILCIYIFALMGLGVPVVLLSTRLSPAAVKHLLQKTGSGAVLVSGRLKLVVDEALESWEEGETNGTGNGTKATAPSQYPPAPLEELISSEGVDITESTAHPHHYISETDRDVLILHSSGTTGLPKPIYTSHRHYFSFALCHELKTDEERLSPTLSTSPLFHGFGLLPPCLSLGIGKPFCMSAPGNIPTGQSTAQLLRRSGAKSLLTVPSIVEEIVLLPNDEGVTTLQELHFVAFGGGLPKETIGQKLTSMRVKLINHYGATETGPLSPFYVPQPDYDWHYFKFRTDILKPLQVQFNSTPDTDEDSSQWQLSLQPLGWEERFHVQDLLVSRPGSDTDFTVLGRSDDLIRLATGEKVRPTILESMLVQHEAVKAAVAFGDGQFEIGVLVEPMQEVAVVEHEQFKLSLWPVIEAANEKMDSHALISSSAAVVIVKPGSLPRSDKGTIIRRDVPQRFEAEIASVYEQLEKQVDKNLSSTSPLSMDNLEAELQTLILQNLAWRVRQEDLTYESDLFELGMDSLQATILRRLLASRVNDASRITRDFVYQHSSIGKIARALKSAETTNPIEAFESYIEKYSLSSTNSGATVLLTGSTGSLGAHLLVHLAQCSNVDRVICLNRPSAEDPYERQRQSLESKGLFNPEPAWRKIDIFQTNTSLPQLGLPIENYRYLQGSVTHILHNAWPMNFKLGLSSYEAQFRVLQNLLLLAQESHYRHPQRKPRVLFTSSISVVGHYGERYGETIVPETSVSDFNVSLELGYAKAKLVCEKIIERSVQDAPGIEAGYVRVGQVAGSSSGYWNTDEHFVALVASSKKIGKLPNIHGTLSWLPVDTAAIAMSEILLSPEPLQLVYHLENPIRQPWHDTLNILAAGLGLGKDDRLPFADWVKAVRSVPEDGNPAKKLVEFFEQEFERMSGGQVILDTSVSRKYAPTLRVLGPVAVETIQRYLECWSKSILSDVSNGASQGI